MLESTREQIEQRWEVRCECVCARFQLNENETNKIKELDY